MQGINLLKSVRYYDDNDEFYNEYNITFEYNGKKYIAIHIVAFSGAWNYKVIGYLPQDFQRLHGGGKVDWKFDETTFTYEELIEAANLLELSGKDELCYADYEHDGRDKEAKRLRKQIGLS